MRFRKMDTSLKDMEKDIVITVSPKGKVTSKKSSKPETVKKPEQVKTKKPFLGGQKEGIKQKSVSQRGRTHSFMPSFLVPKPEKVGGVKPKKGKEKKPVDEEAVFRKRSKALEYALVVWGISIALYFILLLWNLLTASPSQVVLDRFPMI